MCANGGKYRPQEKKTTQKSRERSPHSSPSSKQLQKAAAEAEQRTPDQLRKRTKEGKFGVTKENHLSC